jgi:hypothetical protein
MPDDWSREEVEAAVADYFDMLAKEIRGEPFNKAQHNRNLRKLLSNRSHGSVERKHQNISAVLIGLGFPYVSGYKPLANAQKLLRAIVSERVARATGLKSAISDLVEKPALKVPHLGDLLTIQVEPPRNEQRRLRIKEQPSSDDSPIRRNYLEMEARNRSLGLAGEELAIRFERQRLERNGYAKLAAQIRHVSQSEGDYLGYDILSFEGDGRERLIEVKTTRFGPSTPFFASRNEVEVSEQREREYHLYRLFAFDSCPKFFELPGSLRESCELDPFVYSAIPA